jgi:hypothetical protein
MHRRDKKTKREISRATGLSRNTVAKWLDEAQPVEPKYRREAAKPQAVGVRGGAQASLEGRCQAAQEGAAHGQGLFAQIKAAGYDGGYTG